MNCRSCKAEIFWVKTAATGKAIPLDKEPTAYGNIQLRSEPPNIVAHYLKAEEIQMANAEAFKLGRRFADLYTSHFATCPDAAKWRKK